MNLKYLKSVFFIPVLLLGYCEVSNAQVNEKDSLLAIDKNHENKNIAFAKQKGSTTTTAISTVKGSELEQNFSINLGNTLYGRLPGLTVSQGTSEPGAGTQGFVIRGRNTLGNSISSPLIIIDGFLGGGAGIGSVFAQLVPEEIESITVLKDAASTAMYGSRGANGVILVTTKKGAKGPLSIGFSTRQGFGQAAYTPKALNSAEYAILYNEARQNDGLAPQYDDNAIEAYRTGSDPYLYPNVNWYKEVLRKTAPVSSYNLNFRGGDNTVTYYAMLNAIGNQGLYKKFGDLDDESSNSYYNRYNFRSNLDINVSKRLSVTFKLAGSIEQKQNPYQVTTDNTFNTISSLAPNVFPVFNPNGTYGNDNPALTERNPVANLRSGGYDQTNGRTLQTSLRFAHQLDMITKGLSVSGAVSINNFFISTAERNKTYESFRIRSRNPESGDYIYDNVIGKKSFLSADIISTRNQYRNFELQGTLNYQRTFDKHDIEALLLVNSDNSTLNNSLTGNGLDPYKHNGASTRLTYVYNKKYIAEFSAGYMGSENFPKGDRYGFFPSGSAGWVISEEGFLKNNKTVNFLKLRASYGLAGNDDMGGTRYAFDQTYDNNGTENTLANPLITWEKEKSFNGGFDATVLNRFDLNFDVFNRQRYDILVSPSGTIPTLLGARLPDLNQGKTSSKGVEAALRYNSTSGKKLNYFVETNFSYYRNTVVFNAQADQINKNLITAGLLNGQPLRLIAIGFITPEDLEARAIDSKNVPAPLDDVVRAGDIKYMDIGGPEGKPDGVIDGNDIAPSGNTGTPRYTLGLNSGFRYKGFDFNFVMQAVTGNTTYLSGNLFYAFQNTGTVTPIALGRWTPETAASATYPRLSSNNNTNNYRGSSFWERDGSFIKLRSAELGYTLPENISKKVKLSASRFFITGTNLFSIDHIEYGDPESLSGYPVLRTFILGAKLNF